MTEIWKQILRKEKTAFLHHRDCSKSMIGAQRLTALLARGLKYIRLALVKQGQVHVLALRPGYKNSPTCVGNESEAILKSPTWE